MGAHIRTWNIVKSRLQLILLGIVALAAAVDIVWVEARHFDADAAAYAAIALLSLACAAGGLFYERVRKDERLAAMLMGTSFLLGMSASFSVLNYLLITVAGARIDAPLAELDRGLGVNWPAMMAVVAQHPILNAILQLGYISVLPQVALLVAALGWDGKQERIYAFCLALSAGAAISIGFWTLAPSFGAFSVYELPSGVTKHLALALDGRYAKDLVGLLAHGPGHIAPSEAKGLIGFPSYHAAMALLVVWYARDVSFLRWLVVVINCIVLVATPIQGGHHVVDVVAGAAVAVVSVLLAKRVVDLASRSRVAQAIEAQPTAV